MKTSAELQGLQSSRSRCPSSTTGIAPAKTFQRSSCCNARSNIQQHPYRRYHQAAHEAPAYEKSYPREPCAFCAFEDTHRSSVRLPLTWGRYSATSMVATANKPAPDSKHVQTPSQTLQDDQYWVSGKQCFHKPPRHWPSGHLT